MNIVKGGLRPPFFILWSGNQAGNSGKQAGLCLVHRVRILRDGVFSGGEWDFVAEVNYFGPFVSLQERIIIRVAHENYIRIAGILIVTSGSRGRNQLLLRR